MKVAIVMSMEVDPDEPGDPVFEMIGMIREAMEGHRLSHRIDVHAAIRESAEEVMAIFAETEEPGGD